MRRLVAVLLIGLVAVPAGAQGRSAPKSVRVRITGPDTYHVPGVVTVERDRIQGQAAKITDRLVQFVRSSDGQLVTIPRPGHRLNGQALAIVDGLLEFVGDGESERLYLPLDAVTKIEMSRVSHSRLTSSVGGITVGVPPHLPVQLVRHPE